MLGAAAASHKTFCASKLGEDECTILGLRRSSNSFHVCGICHCILLIILLKSTSAAEMRRFQVSLL